MVRSGWRRWSVEASGLPNDPVAEPRVVRTDGLPGDTGGWEQLDEPRVLLGRDDVVGDGAARPGLEGVQPDARLILGRESGCRRGYSSLRHDCCSITPIDQLLEEVVEPRPRLLVHLPRGPLLFGGPWALRCV